MSRKMAETRLRNIFFITLTFFPSFLFSQYQLTGKIADPADMPLEFAEVSLLTHDSLLTQSTYTKEDGSFQFENVHNGEYILEVFYLSKKIHSRELIISKDLDLGKIKISFSQILKEVVIIGKRKVIEQKVDRIVFNTEDLIAAQGGSALDVLKITPRVKVDNDNLSIAGKGGIRVMVNERDIQLSGEDLTNYLKSISADEIKSIEVITNPPAKYSAEGNSGLINIVLKSGVRDAWSNTVRTSFQQGTYVTPGIGNTFNYNKPKLSINASIEGKTGYSIHRNDYIIFFPGNLNISNSNNKKKEDFYSGRLGVDYKLSKGSEMGFIVQGNKSFPDTKEFIHLDIFDANNNPKNENLTNARSDGKSGISLYNLHFSQRLDTLGRKLNIEFNHFNYYLNKTRVFTSKSYQNNVMTDQFTANNIGSQRIKNYNLLIDMEHPSKWANFNYGFNMSFNKSQNENSFYNFTGGSWILNRDLSDSFDYSENVWATYFDMQKQLNKKWQTKIGLRYENTHTTGISASNNQIEKRLYHKFFPTAYLLYMLNENNSFNLNYGRRISRPDFWELNPFKLYLNKNSYVEGNPSLEPSYTHNIEFTHSFKQKLFSTLFLQFVENGSVIIPVRNGWFANFFTQNIFKFNKKETLSGEIDFDYSSPSKALMFDITGSYSLDLGLRYALLDKKLNVNMVVSDIFKTSIARFTTYPNSVKQVYKNDYDSRFVRISLSYKFGNKKINVEKKGTGNMEELNRLKN